MNKERLSRLIDGDLDAHEIEAALDELLENPELQHSWNAMHIARAAMRSEEGGDVPITIADKVALSLENEATIMAPNNISVEQAPPVQADNVVPMRKNLPKAWVYTAVAASVAAVVMLSYAPQKEPIGPGIADSNIDAAQPNLDMELQSMIVQHGEFSGVAALNGLAAYAKVVNGSVSEY